MWEYVKEHFARKMFTFCTFLAMVIGYKIPLATMGAAILWAESTSTHKD